ncbi:Dipeptidyl-peptidase_I [Hexamita inflata]|uniref:Dipeptidyl-peptidase I n=1 Tax=Hexamita inflata TaxID=28002 RepID=A0AA86NF97_9EUKA|nr:Dipeptidyl-peptidase I [Hexamita inflata]
MIIVCFIITETPAICFSDQVLGQWEISFSSPKTVKQPTEIKCKNQIYSYLTKKITLRAPNVAIDENGVYGTWTFAYTQAVQIVIDGLDILWYVGYEYVQDGVFSYCSKSQNSLGWAHSQGISNKKHYCVKAKNIKPTISNTTNYYQYGQQNMFKKSHKDLLKSQILSQSTNYSGSSLPNSFDWRNVNGKSYIPEVFNQLYTCGSCYICAVLHMMMSRIMIKRNSPGVYPKLSIQQLIDCNFYSQGCNGGFPEQVGRYAENFGITTEEIYGSYLSADAECKYIPDTEKYYFTATQLLGGYLGAVTDSTEIQYEIFRYGPVAVSVMGDKLFNDYDPYGKPFQPTETNSDHPERHYFYSQQNHIVLLIGWITEEVEINGQKENQTFWILHNSFGKTWGPNQDGTMKVIMGRNAYGIESQPVTTYYFDLEVKDTEVIIGKNKFIVSSIVLGVLCVIMFTVSVVFAFAYCQRDKRKAEISTQLNNTLFNSTQDQNVNQ